jgi:hypothetical protein
MQPVRQRLTNTKSRVSITSYLTTHHGAAKSACHALPAFLIMTCPCSQPVVPPCGALRPRVFSRIPLSRTVVLLISWHIDPNSPAGDPLVLGGCAQPEPRAEEEAAGVCDGL